MVAFKPVSWQPNEPISKDKLSQMVQNDQYLFDNTANMVYRDVAGLRTVSSLKLIAGVVAVGATKGSQTPVNVNYGGEFNTGITPIITYAPIITNSADYQVTATLRGNGSALPNDAGFQFLLNSPGKALTGTVYFHYMALGVASRISAAPE